MKFITPDWQAPANIKAFTTVRTGWGNREPHHDQTRGQIYAADPKSMDESRKLVDLLKMPSDPIWLDQTHSAIAIEAKPENKEKVGDASFTTKPNHVCVILTADCLPIMICNKQGTHVAVIHAGWRGLANGVIESTLSALQQPSNDLLVWLGPAIGPEKFEVGVDVYTAFTQIHPEATSAFIPHREGKWMANLYELAKLRLQQQGITTITGGNYCTYSQPDLFFSYRRDQGKTGRMASVIWIDRL